MNLSFHDTKHIGLLAGVMLCHRLLHVSRQRKQLRSGEVGSGGQWKGR